LSASRKGAGDTGAADLLMAATHAFVKDNREGRQRCLMFNGARCFPARSNQESRGIDHPQVTGPEVVERNADAEILELLHNCQRSVTILEQQTFGDFQLQPLCRKSRLRHRRYDLQGKAAVPELYRRKIDGNLDAFWPFRRFEAGVLQYPFAQGDNQASKSGPDIRRVLFRYAA
jgi:hypothetical protein